MQVLKSNENIKRNGLAVIAGIIMIAAASLIKPFIIGVSFTFTFISLIGAFILIWGLLGLLSSNRDLALPAKILKKMMILGIILGMVSFVIIESIIIENAKSDPTGGCHYVLVLGAGLHGKTPSLILSSRLQKAYQFLQKNPNTTAVLCGGRGPNETITEAEAMKQYLISKGIPANRLILENRSRSTDQNIKFAGQILDRLEGPIHHRVVIITNDFHLYRAKKLALDYKMIPSGISVPTPDYYFLKYNYFLREYFSVAAYYIQQL